jgi:hypothetical protein
LSKEKLQLLNGIPLCFIFIFTLTQQLNDFGTDLQTYVSEETCLGLLFRMGFFLIIERKFDFFFFLTKFPIDYEF